MQLVLDSGKVFDPSSAQSIYQRGWMYSQAPIEGSTPEKSRCAVYVDSTLGIVSVTEYESIYSIGFFARLFGKTAPEPTRTARAKQHDRESLVHKLRNWEHVDDDTIARILEKIP